jgi:hypothetical protein
MAEPVADVERSSRVFFVVAPDGLWYMLGRPTP